MKNILLTGGNGFIGKNILESFLADKYSIKAPSSKELDLVDEESVEKYFSTYSPDIVIHAAVKPSHRNAIDFNNILYSNTRMFFNLERYSQYFEKMLVIGSGAIYDMRYYHSKMKEEDYIRHIPVDEHGYCKYICEKVIEKSSNIYDLRVFGIYGKYEDYAIRFISNAICKTIFNLPITIKQNRKFDYLFIDDLMPILDWFITQNPLYKSYNITPDNSVSLQELAFLVNQNANRELPIKIVQDGLGLEYSGDNSRLKNEYQSIHFTSPSEGIKKLFKWYNSRKNIINKELLLIDK
ncbi:NAD(P)-dependent oxidoreductase [Bacteroides sp. 224]|uniref:NAD-dependent epimerase/dehydratase family protein n=1 Tax=Bacteroides sp. 224 TaxID=2302936 RepID=UPI0013D0DB26|nr:NAD(P)-dependent oxidoreductase [Bacteroides sp. 224]NDV64454.1 NAD(P)-dependent oxidoreductase [Bacteroides sp. 224]